MDGLNHSILSQARMDRIFDENAQVLPQINSTSTPTHVTSRRRPQSKTATKKRPTVKMGTGAARRMNTPTSNTRHDRKEDAATNGGRSCDLQGSKQGS